MIEESDAQFISDLARLAEKYGPEPFARLASVVQDPEQAYQLGEILNAVSSSQAERQIQPPRRSRTSLPGETILRELRKSNIAMYNAILLFRGDYMSGKILPALTDVRNFAQFNGLSIGRATSRDSALVPLLRSLATLSLDDMNGLYEDLIQRDWDRNSRPTLGQLRDAIIGSSRKDT